MRHGRLASAIAFAALTGLAAGQSRPTEFGIDRGSDAPTVAAPARPLPRAIDLTPAAADAQDKDKPKLIPSTDQPPKTIPPTADKATDAAVPPGTPTTLPPTALPSPPPGPYWLAPATGPAANFSLFGAGPIDPYQYWVSAEYLWWRIRKDTVPPLVTTGPATFPVAFLGNAGTTVLLSGKLEQDTLTGVRVRGGMWLDDCHTIGIEGSFFCLPNQTHTSVLSSDQFPVLARPFTDVNPGGPNSEFLAFPGLATGNISVSNETRFCGATVAARCPVCANCWGQVDALTGFQYLRLEEKLTIVENSLGSPNITIPGAAGTQFIGVDQFHTKNNFYGGFIGLDAHANYGCWVFGAYGTVGVGCNHEQVEATGSQTSLSAAGTTTRVGNLLALNSNIGRSSRNETSYTSELGFTVGYQLTSNIQVFGGYSFLYWKNVVRPGSEIDPLLDVNRINLFSGPAATSVHPVVPFNQVDFWAQGVSAGVKFSW
jgi:hypothetical protein